MQTITKNVRYSAAHSTLAELSAAFNAATAEESRLLGLLAAPAAASFDPLAAGLRLLRGEPAQRNDSTGINRELAQVRERLWWHWDMASRHKPSPVRHRAPL